MKYRGVTKTAVATLLGVCMGLCLSLLSIGQVSASDEVDPTANSLQTGMSGATWDSCSSLTWKIRRPGLSRQSIAQIRTAIRQLNAATGLNFTYGGHATRSEWGNPSEESIVIGLSPTLAKKNFGGITRLKKVQMANSDGLRIVSARIEINPSLLSGRMATYFMPVVLHELGHAVGLTHVSDSADIMYPVAVKGASYRGASLTKLSAVGVSEACKTN